MARAPQQAGPPDDGPGGFAPGFQLFQLEEFKGLNTKPQRPAIDDQEMAWCENWMPIGPANLRTMAGKGNGIYNEPNPAKSIVWAFNYNIGSTGYAALFISDGTALQVRLSDGAQTTISASPLFYTPGGDLPHAVQWANKGILIVTTAQTDGYFAWDGTTLYKPGDTAPSWLSGLLVPISLTGNTNSNGTLTNISPDPIASGVVTGMNIVDVTNPGDLAAHTLVTGGTTNTITIAPNALGSHVGDTFTVNWMMPLGIQGTAIETFENRVWIINGIVLLTSAASNGTAFAAANGGVSKTSDDNTLRVKYVGLKEANGYLYIYGDSSNYYITNIQTTGTTQPTTTYQYTPLDEQIGTPWRDSIQPFGRSVLFANVNGVYATFGSSSTKISDALDGLFATGDFTTVTPSAGAVTMFGVKVACLNFRAKNPFTGTTYNMIGLFDGKRWWTATQETAPIFICQQELNSTLATYGTDGRSYYQCFLTPSLTLTKTLISKLWGGEYGFLSRKNVLRLYAELGSPEGEIANIIMKLDNERGAISASIPVPFGTELNWVNNSQQAITFVNNSNQPLHFVVNSGIGAVNAYGSGLLLGYTLTSVSKDIVLLRAAIGYKPMTALF